MEETTKATQAGVHDQDLEQVAQRFKRWRDNHRRGEHVPQDLWAAAVGLTKTHGVRRVADELALDFERLDKRVQQASGTPTAGHADTHFVEVLTAPMPMPMLASAVRECVIEVENALGAKMRIELAGKGLAALADLCNAFCGAR